MKSESKMINRRPLGAIVASLTMALTPFLMGADILTAVPMQGGMVMPMVSYNAAEGRLHVSMPDDVPQLIPLLVSNPEDGFDLQDPWFAVLDPSRQGAAFSRRYGFVVDAMSDSLPSETQIWIRKLSGPQELLFYRYSSSPPKAFAPIFGTDGATNSLYWNGMMFHPVVAAPPGTNHYTATFEVFLIDSVTGQEVAGSSSGPVELHWSDTLDGRPILNLSRRIVVSWPLITGTNWVIESASNASADMWTTVTNTSVVVDGQLSVIVDSGIEQQYFRARRLP